MENHHQSLGKRTLQGAGIALVMVIIFLLFLLFVGGVWVSLPMATVPIGGALGAMFYYLMVKVWFRSGWKKVFATIFSILVYLIFLWLSLVIAFSITGHWD